MIESPLIAQLLAEVRAKAEVEAWTRAKVEVLLRVIQKRHRELPEELATSIRGCTDRNQLDHWLDMAVEAETLVQFRQQAGL